MDIILDTNIIFKMRGRQLDSPELKMIAAVQTLVGGSILIPQVVIDELANLYRRDLDDCLAKIGKDYRTLNGMLIGTGIELASPLLGSEVAERYRDRLLTQCAELNATVLGFPATPHSELTSRAIARRKPFKENGAGYRDAIIWESILARRESPSIVFVTDNASDFLDAKAEGLHADLREDMDRLGIPTESIRVCRTLKQAFELHFLPYLQECYAVEAVGEADEVVGFIGDLWANCNATVTQRVQEVAAVTDREVSQWVGQKVFGARICDVDLNIIDGEIGEGCPYNPPEPSPLFYSPVVKGFVSVEFLIERSNAASLEPGVARLEEQDQDRDVLVGTACFEARISMSIVWDVNANMGTTWDIEGGELVGLEVFPA